jgi:hypothetical protein
MTLADPVLMEWTARLHMTVFGVVVMLGALVGAVLALLYPPMRSSDAAVLVVAKSPATQERLTTSNPVLSAASSDYLVSYERLGSLVVAVTVQAHTAAGAEDAANAVVRSYARQISSPDVRAAVLDLASPATGTTLPVWVGGFAMLGALAGAGLMIMWRPVLPR